MITSGQISCIMKSMRVAKNAALWPRRRTNDDKLTHSLANTALRILRAPSKRVSRTYPPRSHRRPNRPPHPSIHSHTNVRYLTSFSSAISESTWRSAAPVVCLTSAASLAFASSFFVFLRCGSRCFHAALRLSICARPIVDLVCRPPSLLM